MIFYLIYIPVEVSLLIILHNYLIVSIIYKTMMFIIILDILLNFNKTCIKEGILEYDRKKIAKNYLFNWFIPDVICVFCVFLLFTEANEYLGLFYLV